MLSWRLETASTTAKTDLEFDFEGWVKRQ